MGQMPDSSHSPLATLVENITPSPGCISALCPLWRHFLRLGHTWTPPPLGHKNGFYFIFLEARRDAGIKSN